MQMTRALVFAAAAMAFTILPGYAADIAHGRALAQRWCAACHIVAAGQKQANADAPPFVTIAHSNFDAKTLAYFLLDPHPKMPTLPLSRTAADDLAAYIESLR